jgi:hypothetical protein
MWRCIIIPTFYLLYPWKMPVEEEVGLTLFWRKYKSFAHAVD